MPTPDFVLRLREKIGHDLLWLPGVTAVILSEDSTQVLLVRRSDTGAWTPVTGMVEPGEEPATCALREAEEETGVVAEIVGLAAVSSDTPVTFPNGDRCQFLDLTFRCRYVSGLAHAADEESSEARWFPVDDRPAMAPHLEERLARALAFDGRASYRF